MEDASVQGDTELEIVDSRLHVKAIDHDLPGTRLWILNGGALRTSQSCCGLRAVFVHQHDAVGIDDDHVDIACWVMPPIVIPAQKKIRLLNASRNRHWNRLH